MVVWWTCSIFTRLASCVYACVTYFVSPLLCPPTPPPLYLSVEYVNAVDEKKISGVEAPPEEVALVIPLTKDRWVDPSPPDAETEAVVALLKDAESASEFGGGAAETPVAAIVVPSSGKSAEDGVARPILQASMIPGLSEVDNDTERFKLDLAHRADNISVKSMCYDSVPICNFGEALLRGMGWDGSRSEAEQAAQNQVRPSRLGLGAKARPPSPPSKNKVRRPGEAKRPENDKWAKEAARKLEAQKLGPGMVVWLRDPRFVQRSDVTRARVVRTAGVPGLNRVEVALEETGEVVHVLRTDAILVEADELSSKPFKEPATSKRERSQAFSDRAASGDQAAPEKKPRTGHRAVESWLQPNIRVRVIRKGPHERTKGEVVRLEDGRANIRLDGGIELKELREKDLETVVPSVGDEVCVVRGRFQRYRGKIKKKDRDREEVCLEIDGKREWLKFDDVSSSSC